MKNVLLIAAVSFVLHVVWETLHLPLYLGYAGLSGFLPIQLYATLGDVFYTLLIVGILSFFKQSLGWLRHPAGADYAALALLGFMAAIFVEYKAQLLHYWTYSPLMPVVWGIGLDPLLQMTILLPLSVYAARRLEVYI